MQQARSQVPSQTQMLPQGRMPMMGSGQSRWMWPHRSMMRGMQGQMGPGMGPWMARGASMVQHMYFMQNGIPSKYSGKVNPLPASHENVRGATPYADNCASCYGARGFGDGEAGKHLNPRLLPAGRRNHRLVQAAGSSERRLGPVTKLPPAAPVVPEAPTAIQISAAIQNKVLTGCSTPNAINLARIG